MNTLLKVLENPKQRRSLYELRDRLQRQEQTQNKKGEKVKSWEDQ